MDDLAGTVPRENAVRAFGVERHQRHVPEPRAIRHRDTPARQPFERLELERRGSRPLRRNGVGAGSHHGPWLLARVILQNRLHCLRYSRHTRPGLPVPALSWFDTRRTASVLAL